MKSFDDLTEREILALAISSEEEDGRIYADFAEPLRESHPGTSQVFSDMAAEENEHRRMLIDLYVPKFGSHIPLVRRQDVRGCVQRKKLWQKHPHGVETVRRQARQMEQDAGRFYQYAALRTTDASIRKLLGDLAMTELKHERIAGEIEAKLLPDGARSKEQRRRRRQPSLRPTDCAAGPRWAHGWVRLDIGSRLRGSVRDAQHVECVLGRHGGLARRGHFYGVCRGAR
jgi:erythrin-vacuolar iron transport family protein